MITTGVLALLLGAVSTVGAQMTSTNNGLTYTWNPINNAYFNFVFNFAADTGYRTLYNAGDDGYIHSEEYSFDIYSYVNATFTMEFFQSYYNTYQFSFIPYDIEPYSQSIDVVRPMSGQQTDAVTYGSYNIQAGEIITTVFQNTKACGASFIDVIFYGASIAPSCAYDISK
jgi:hypothetical protein